MGSGSGSRPFLDSIFHAQNDGKNYVGKIDKPYTTNEIQMCILASLHDNCGTDQRAFRFVSLHNDDWSSPEVYIG